jgi:hypothetical protein
MKEWFMKLYKLFRIGMLFWHQINSNATSAETICFRPAVVAYVHPNAPTIPQTFSWPK